MKHTLKELENLYNLAVQEPKQGESEQVKQFREYIQNKSFLEYMKEKLDNDPNNSDYIYEKFK